MAVLDRPVLLLDEPTFGLDPAQTDAVVDLLLDLARSGTAVAFATHDLALARSVADQVLVLAAGRALAVGDAELLDDAGLLARAGLLVETGLLVERALLVPAETAGAKTGVTAAVR